MSRNYSNSAAPTTLAAPCTDAATTIAVASATGFPAAPFILAVDFEDASQELVLVTGVSGETLNVTRGYDNTSAVAHATGAAVRHVHTAVDFRDSRNHEAASNGVHGVTGSVVGTSDSQALTNKDLSSSTNTFPSSLATDAELSAHTTNSGIHVPLGTLMPFVGALSPSSSWKLADGSELSRTTYAALYAIIGTTYGEGNGVSTFNLPDLRGKMVLGASDDHSRGDTGGAETVTLTTDEIPSHQHGMTHTHSIAHNHDPVTTGSGGAHTHDIPVFDKDWDGNPYRVGGSKDGTLGTTVSNATNQAGSHTHTVNLPNYTGDSGASSRSNTVATGGGEAHENMPPYLTLNWLIRVA